MRPGSWSRWRSAARVLDERADEHAGVRHRDGAGRRARAPPLRPVGTRRRGGRQGHVRAAARQLRRRIPAASAAARGRDLVRAAHARSAQGLESRRPRPRASRSWCRASSTASTSICPIWCPGTASGFDLPVLHYRALKAGVQAPRYWETGDDDHSFRYNNYLSRYHWRHIDLMDVLSGFQPRARAKLNDVAALLGFPGKLGFSGEQVWDAYLAGELLASAATARPTSSTPISSTCASSCCAGAWTAPLSRRSSSACARCCAAPASRTTRSFCGRGRAAA